MHQHTGQDVLREVVRGIAPAELEKLDETCRAYTARPYPRSPCTARAGTRWATASRRPSCRRSSWRSSRRSSPTSPPDASGPAGGRLARWWRRRRLRGAAADERRAALTAVVPELSGTTRQELTDWALAQSRTARLTPAQAEACAHIVVVAVVRPPAEPAHGRAPDAHEEPGTPDLAEGAGSHGEPGEVQAPANTPPS